MSVITDIIEPISRLVADAGVKAIPFIAGAMLIKIVVEAALSWVLETRYRKRSKKLYTDLVIDGVEIRSEKQLLAARDMLFFKVHAATNNLELVTETIINQQDEIERLKTELAAERAKNAGGDR